VQNGLDQKGDVLEKIVVWDFFLELDVESTKNINFEILDPGWHFYFIFACLTWNDPQFKFFSAILDIIENIQL
jgi:hypothetical protein